MVASVQRSARGVVSMAVLTGVAVLAGCGKASTGSNAPSGSVTVALATTGSDGATYQFPAGTSLEVFSSNGFFGSFPIDGAETVLSEMVPVGPYQAQLAFPSNGPVQLVRTLNGMSQTVAATWSDPQPFTFTIFQNMTTPVVLHFSVVGLGDVTFQIGRLLVSIDVNATTTTMPTGAQQSGVVTVSTQTIVPGFGLETPLGLTVGEVDSESISVSLTAAFQPSSPGVACATGTLSAISAPMSSAAFTALVEELEGTPAASVSVCVFDEGTTDIVTLEPARFGAAPADQQAFLPGSNYDFIAFVQFTVGDVYDGTTLKLSQLGVPIALGSGNGAIWEHLIFDFDTNQSLEFSFGNIGSGTFQLTP